MSAAISLNEPLASLIVMLQPLKLSITNSATGQTSIPSIRCQDWFMLEG